MTNPLYTYHAFPVASDTAVFFGMSLVDFYAASALQGLLASPDVQAVSNGDYITLAFEFAEHMVAEREKRILQSPDPTSSTTQ